MLSPVYLTRFLTFPWQCLSHLGGGGSQNFLPLDFNTPFSSCFTKHARLFAKMSSTFWQICLNLAVNYVRNPIFKHQTLIFCQKVDDFRIFCSVSGEEWYEAFSSKIFRFSAEFSASHFLKAMRILLEHWLLQSVRPNNVVFVRSNYFSFLLKSIHWRFSVTLKRFLWQRRSIYFSSYINISSHEWPRFCWLLREERVGPEKSIERRYKINQ